LLSMARTITSSHNEKLKEIRKLRMRRRERDRAGRFVAEGEDLLGAADAAGWEPLERFCAAGSGLTGVEVEPEVLDSASGLACGTRALAVYQERWASAPRGPLCVYLHGVHDPGNAGAVLRSAAAFGASCVAFGPGSADPFGPKAVRASMGAVFTVPVARARTLDELPGRKLAFVAGSGTPLPALGELWRSSSEAPNPNAKVPEELTLLIGAERAGLPEDIVQAADAAVHIPIETHSLNAAMAATVALYEATRMRHQ